MFGEYGVMFEKKKSKIKNSNNNYWFLKQLLKMLHYHYQHRSMHTMYPMEENQLEKKKEKQKR